MNTMRKKGPYEKYFKHPMDLILAVIALIVLSPILLVTAILVKVKLGSPVIFRQKRPGLNEKIFTMYKFRSMTNNCNENNELLADCVRLTRFGKILRSTSIDELPELINIIKGDMSFVGPRPLLVEYLPLYNELQKHRHDVRPGISGLAQICGRNGICWENKFDFDIGYIEHITFLRDCKIILKTLTKVCQREGISSETLETTQAFNGSIEE